MKRTPSRQKERFVNVFLILLGIFFIVFCVVGTIDGQAEEKKQAQAQQQAATAAKLAARQNTTNKYAGPYCQSHTATHMENVAALVQGGWPIHEGAQPWTADQCTAIIGKLFDQGSTDEKLQAIVDSQVWVGQTWAEFLYSWGLPDDFNSANYGAGTTTQLIYHRVAYHEQYVYIDDGKVSAYQDY